MRKHLKVVESVCKQGKYMIYVETIKYLESMHNLWNTVEIIDTCWHKMIYSEDIEYDKRIWNCMTLAI